MFLFLLEEQVDEWIEQWSAKEKQFGTAAEKLYGLADHVAEDFQNPLIRAADEFRASEAAAPAVSEQILLAVQRQRKIFHSVLQEAIDEGVIDRRHDPDQLAQILYAVFAGLNTARHEPLAASAELHRMAVSVFLHGTAARSTAEDVPLKLHIVPESARKQTSDKP